MPLEVQNPSHNGVAPEEVFAELESLLQSPLFSRSEKLQSFLRFVCETAMRGGAAQINEYLIGVEVFKRGLNYTPSDDSIVRRHAHVLRQKLQEYYATEGAGHSVRIEMPVGRYVPVFRRKEEHVPEQRPPAAVSARKWIRGTLWCLAAGAIFGLGWTAAILHLSVPPGISAATAAIWAPWIGSEAVLCFSNPTAAMVRRFVEPVSRDALAYYFRVRPEQEAPFREKFGLAHGGGIYLQPTIAQTMMGEASAATYLSSLFARTGTPLRTMESRFLSWENLRRGNHILLGGDEENRWVDAVLENYPFRMANPADGSPRSIVNTAPRPGEPRAYLVIGTDETREEYALLSLIPGVAGNQILVICGLNSPASPLATEYLTSDHGMLELLERLRDAAPKHAGSWHFQAVIKVDLRDKVATRASIVSLRVL